MDGSNPTIPTPDPIPDPLTHKKHLAMLDRLSTRRQSKPESTSTPFESVSSFLSLFSSSKQSIESDLTRLLSSSDPKPESSSTIKPALDRISMSISDLDQTLAQNSYFLPSYEVRSCLKSISDLKDSLEKASSQLIPKKRFSFKNKSSSKKDPTELFNRIDEKPEIKAPPSKEVKEDSPGFRSKKGAILVKNFRGLDEGRGDFSLSDLVSCHVYLKGKIRALFVNRVTNCKIFCGPVLGSVRIEGVSGCLFVMASHQIRVHEAKETDFYLRVRSRPIIEDSSGVRFGPYRLVYQGIEEELRDSGLGEETGLWANVDDFKWLRAVQSPNWCVIGEEEWMGVVDASDLEESCNGRKFESHCVEPGLPTNC